MRADVHTETRTIHPRALKELGEEACIALLGIARDLRTGKLPPNQYNQDHWCGTARCIAGHLAERMRIDIEQMRYDMRWRGLVPFPLFFAQSEPPSVHEAADAIERYVYDGSETPWLA